MDTGFIIIVLLFVFFIFYIIHLKHRIYKLKNDTPYLLNEKLKAENLELDLKIKSLNDKLAEAEKEKNKRRCLVSTDFSYPKKVLDNTIYLSDYITFEAEILEETEDEYKICVITNTIKFNNLNSNSNLKNYISYEFGNKYITKQNVKLLK